MKEYRISNFRILIDEEDLQKYDIMNALKLGSIYYNILLVDPKTGKVAVERMKIHLSPVLSAFIKENKGKTRLSNLYSMDKEVYRMYTLQKAINDYLLDKSTREGNIMRVIEKNITMIEKEMPQSNISENEKESSNIVRETLNAKEMIDIIAFIKETRTEETTLWQDEFPFSIFQIPSAKDQHYVELQLSYGKYNEPVTVSTLLCKIHYDKELMPIEYPGRWRRELLHATISEENGHIMNIARKFMNNTKNSMDEKKLYKKSKKIDTKNFNAIQMKVYIKGIHPPIWRRLLVSENITLDDLHLIIQAAFGWSNLAYYSFMDGYNYYSRPVEWGINEDIDSTETRLFDIMLYEGKNFRYSYSMGVEWDLRIHIEKIFKHEPSMKLPACIAGRRNSPDENWDPMEYNDIINEINDPRNRDVAWYRSYDPEKFDLEATDISVKNYKNRDSSDLY